MRSPRWRWWISPNERFFSLARQRDAEAIGAAWARQFSPDEQPAFYVDGRTQEVTIGVSGSARGEGLGARLLSAVLAEAARRRPLPECPPRQSGAPPLRAYRVSPRAGFRRSQPGRRHVIRHDLG